MKRKIYSSFLLSLLLIYGLVIPVNAVTYPVRTVLTMTGIDQGSGNGWCWAATDKMIIQFRKGSSPTLQTLVNQYGDPNNQGGADIYASRDALNAYNVTTSLQTTSLSYTGVQAQIYNNHPIFCRLTNGGGLMYDHAVCLRGYDTSTSSVLYLDPNGGLGHGTTYSNFNNGVKWDGNASIWDDTIFDCQ